jgi:parallel beta-helix repeat protein
MRNRPIWNTFIAKIISLAVVALAASASALCQSTVNIIPGMDIATVVAAHPPGTTFRIYAGTYRVGEIQPKSGDSFVGRTACAPPETSCPAILTGSELLTSFHTSGSLYYVSGQTQQNPVNIPSSDCVAGYSGCVYPEDLYFDNVPLTHVTSLAEVGPGKWFFDYSAHTIYFYDNPSGHTVETSVTPTAFGYTVNNVTIKYLTIEKFAAPILTGAVEGAGSGFGSPAEGANWVVENNEISLNHGDGVRPNFGWQIHNNYIHENGNLGIGGGIGGGNSDGSGTTTSNLLIEGNEVATNNYAHVRTGFGAGGIKLTQTRGVTIRGNYVHQNVGDAIHMDIGNSGTLYDNNTVTDNTEHGIFHEISYASVARNNKLQRNGYIFPNGTMWLYGANLLSATSQGLEGYCNTVEVSSQGGNGTDILTQPRPGYSSSNNYFHHNTVTFDGNSGWTGGAQSDQPNFFTSNNRFDYNTYHVPELSRDMFAWDNRVIPFATYQSLGADPHSTADTKYTTAPPTVVITGPTDGTSVSGTVGITGNAQDSGSSISKVEFYVDWSLKSTEAGSSFPFNFTWNTSGVSAGAHTIAAMAYNAAGIQACYAVTLNVP